MEWNIIWGSTRFNLRAFIVQYFHMFYFLENFDIANYADDSTLYNADKNVNLLLIIKKIRH